MTRRTQPRPATDADLECEADARRCEEAWADEEAEEMEREYALRCDLRRTFGLSDDTEGTDEF